MRPLVDQAEKNERKEEGHYLFSPDIHSDNNLPGLKIIPCLSGVKKDWPGACHCNKESSWLIALYKDSPAEKLWAPTLLASFGLSTMNSFPFSGEPTP
jgi:hypothetical protein